MKNTHACFTTFLCLLDFHDGTFFSQYDDPKRQKQQASVELC